MGYNNQGFFDEEASPSEWESVNEGLENVGDVEQYITDPNSTIERAEDVVDESYELEEEEFDTLNEARLRLEQARLYEMFLQHNLFDGVAGHPQAISTVQQELKEYILERLEILLGIRSDNKKYQEPSNSDLDTDQIGFLKQLANKGMQRGLSPIVKPQANTGLKSIGTKKKAPIVNGYTPTPKQPAKKVQKQKQKKRPAPKTKAEFNSAIDEIAKQDIAENKNRKSVDQMTAQELLQYNKKVSKKYTNPTATPVGGLAMPTSDQQNMMVEDMVNNSQETNSLAALINKHKGE